MAPRPRTSLTFGTVTSHLGVLVGVAVVMGVLVAGLAIPAVTALGFGARSAATSLNDLPEELQAEPLAERSRVLGAKGGVIATFYDQNRVNVSLDQIAPIMQRAVVSIEDDRFYEHGALDLKGTLRAFLTNQTSSGSMQGGSSITQQMAKMTSLFQARTAEERKAATEDTYRRKVQELRHAIAFEQNYSKDWILNRYLNIAYFGDGAYGVQAAARHYFSRDAADLNLKQAALLAGLVKNPLGYDPTKYPDRAKARRQVVLDRMAQLGVIPRERADKVGAKGLGLEISPAPNGCVGSVSPFFCDYVRRYLLADPSLGKTVEDRQQLLNSGGLTIKTTMLASYQRAATDATKNRVHPTDNAVGALAMVEPGTGNVRAIAQSKPMGRDKSKGETFLNRAVPRMYGDAAGFQPGSTFKLFVLAAALQQGLPPTTSFYSPHQVNIKQSEFRTCKGAYGNLDTWDPQNSTTDGQKTMYTGMQESVNTFFAQLERQTGICMPYQLAVKMGVHLTEPQRQQVPSFTLGVADASPLEMAAAYATMPARGKFCAPRPVTEILNSDGEVFKKYPPQCTQVVQPGVADRVNDILRGVMTGRGFGAGLALDKPSAGKTGTSQENKAVWFNGYTPTMSTSAVVGGVNDKGYPASLNGVRVGGNVIGTAHGSTIAGPLWADAMRAVQDEMPYKNFNAPPAPPSQSGLPSVNGSSVDTAKAAIRRAGFTPQLAGAVDGSYSAGSVAQISLSPDNKTVYIYTSTGHAGYAPPAPDKPGKGKKKGRGGRDDNDRGNNGRGHGNGNGQGNGNGRGRH